MRSECFLAADDLRLLQGDFGVRPLGDAGPVVERRQGTDDEKGQTQLSETRQAVPDGPFNDGGEDDAPGEDIDPCGDRDRGEGDDPDGCPSSDSSDHAARPLRYASADRMDRRRISEVTPRARIGIITSARPPTRTSPRLRVQPATRVRSPEGHPVVDSLYGLAEGCDSDVLTSRA